MEGHVDKAELVKWWDLLDDLMRTMLRNKDLAASLEIARTLRHPDAEWLASLFLLAPARRKTTWCACSEL
jgi:hypothetical protein